MLLKFFAIVVPEIEIISISEGDKNTMLLTISKPII